jgi:transcriptional regulator with XRE-family HTH domain
MPFEEHIPNERLRRARHLKGWTQSQLAEILDTDFETVSRWERGISVPSAYFRERLYRVLDQTPEELGLIADLTEPLALSTSPAVFLAAAYADAECGFVTRLKAHLQARGVTVLSSRTLRRQGVENQRKALQAAIRATQAVLLIASPEARSSRLVQKALQIAGIYRSPICAVWIDGEYRQEGLPPDFGELFATIDARKTNDTRVFDEIAATLEGVWLASIKTAISVPPTTESAGQPLEPRNPYKGLKAFHTEDRDDFFGRDTLVDDLAETLNGSLIADAKYVQSARLLAVVGPSGSGKSSVVMAGLLPRLQAGGLPGSQHWVYLDPMIPGVHPIEALALAFAKQLPDRSLTTLRDNLEDDSAYGLHLLAGYLGKAPERRVVLFIDQFEEVFTQAASEEERRHFLDLLVTAVTEPQGPTILILTLRADFYEQPMYYPELFQLIEAQHSFVLPMDLKGLREVIEKPAGLPDVQLTFEGDLVSDLLFEVQEQVGALPLLQFSLDQLFQMRRGHQLTLQAYREMGGVKGAIAKHAEATYATLPSDEHRKLARALFLRLIDPGATVQDTTRRRIARSELLLSNLKETAIIEEVTHAFTTARLLTTDTVSGVATVEVSHEAVIREWSRLADWLDEAREDVHRQQTISEDAAEWERHGKPRDRLYRGTQLKEAQVWARRNMPSRFEIAFLRASRAQRMLSIASLVAVLLLLLSITGTAVWLRLNQPPDPTRVTNLQDDGIGSLRWAINYAPSGSTITFDASLTGTIMLTSDTSLIVARNLTIRGPATHILWVSGGGISSDRSGPYVYVVGGVSVTISNLNFGNSTSPLNRFISNDGTLTLINSTVSGNAGCGISNFGTLTITNTTISDNSDQSDCSGIFNDGTLTLTNSTVSGNSSQSDGGGIFDIGLLTLTNTTISGNSSYGGGAGIEIESQQNAPPAQVDLIFSTIYGNTVRTGATGADIEIKYQSPIQLSQVRIRNSIIVGAPAHSGPDISGKLSSYGYNLFQNNSGATFNPSTRTQHSTDKTLSVNEVTRVFASSVEPRDNGGSTKTYALAPASPAIDQIPLDACLVNGITTDQRGMKRPDRNEQSCDIGAYEYTDRPA